MDAHLPYEVDFECISFTATVIEPSEPSEQAG